MFPRYSPHDFTDMALAYSIFIRKALLRYTASAIAFKYGSDRMFGYFRKMIQLSILLQAKPFMAFSSWVQGQHPVVPAFPKSVAPVVDFLTKKMMLRVATRRIVAGVANEMIDRVYPIVKKISDAVSSKGRSVCPQAGGREAVAFFISTKFPFPALIWTAFIDTTPENLNPPCCKVKHRGMLNSSHLISLIGRWLGPCGINEISRGSFYFMPERVT